MSDMHYEDPSFEIVDDDDGTYSALLGSIPVVLIESDEPPTGEPLHKGGDHTDEDADAEVLREI
jgi:hypothetical protein